MFFVLLVAAECSYTYITNFRVAWPIVLLGMNLQMIDLS